MPATKRPVTLAQGGGAFCRFRNAYRTSPSARSSGHGRSSAACFTPCPPDTRTVRAPVHRNEWKAVARARAREAKALLAASEWSGAYYLSGYAVECGLKACIAREFRSGAIPEKNLVSQIHTHKLDTLVNLAGLQASRAALETADPLFAVNWTIAKDWSESTRYALWAEPEARDMVNAIASSRHGVLKWVRGHW